MNTQNKQTKININTSSDNGNHCDEDKTALEAIRNSSEIESENTHLKSSNNTVPLNQKIQSDCTKTNVKNSNVTETDVPSTTLKRNHKENHSISAESQRKKQKLEDSSFKKAVSNVASQSKDSIRISEKHDVRKNDQIALIVNGDPIINLTDSQAKIIERWITDDLKQSLKKRLPFELAFYNKELSNGRYRITYANTASLKWLIQRLASMGTLWNGAKLGIMVHEYNQVTVLIPHIDDSYEDVVRLIKIQNPCINTDSWKFFKKKSKTQGNLFTLGIDKESLDFIEANEGALFYSVGVVRFLRARKDDKIPDDAEYELVTLKKLSGAGRKRMKRFIAEGFSYCQARNKAINS